MKLKRGKGLFHLGSSQPLTEMSTMNLPRGIGQPACKADNLTVICELIVYKMWEPRSLSNLGRPRPVTGITLPYLLRVSSSLVRIRPSVYFL
jgi:hypothetical protein